MRILIQLLFGIFLFIASIQDVRTRQLPLAQMLAGPVIVAVIRILSGGMDYLQSTELWLSVVCGCFFVGVSWLSREKLGFADSIAIVGIFLSNGYETGMIMVFAGFLIAGAVAIILLLAGKAGKNTAIPFLPFLFLGYVGGLVLTLWLT